jgi:hypothetical protein
MYLRIFRVFDDTSLDIMWRRQLDSIRRCKLCCDVRMRGRGECMSNRIVPVLLDLRYRTGLSGNAFYSRNEHRKGEGRIFGRSQQGIPRSFICKSDGVSEAVSGCASLQHSCNAPIPSRKARTKFTTSDSTRDARWIEGRRIWASCVFVSISLESRLHAVVHWLNGTLGRKSSCAYVNTIK